MLGRVPPLHRYTLPAGVHELELRNPGLPTHKDRIVIPPGGTLPFTSQIAAARAAPFLSMMMRLLALALLLLLPRAAWADPLPGIALYDDGEYAAAAQSFEEALKDEHRAPEEKVLARIYLAASLHVLGRGEASRAQRRYWRASTPRCGWNPVRFPPELVALAEGIRERIEADKRFAEQVALNERMKEEAERNWTPPVHLRLEGLGLNELQSRAWRTGVGLTLSRGLLEATGRTWLGGPALHHLQVGLTPGSGPLRPFLGLRAVLVPSAGAMARARCWAGGSHCPPTSWPWRRWGWTPSCSRTRPTAGSR